MAEASSKKSNDSTAFARDANVLPSFRNDITTGAPPPLLRYAYGPCKQGILHDLSKYSPTELKTGAKYWVGTRSPNSIERETIGYSSAWLHHKGRNKHHWEYWVDFSRQGVVPAKMPTNVL